MAQYIQPAEALVNSTSLIGVVVATSGKKNIAGLLKVDNNPPSKDGPVEFLDIEISCLLSLKPPTKPIGLAQTDAGIRRFWRWRVWLDHKM